MNTVAYDPELPTSSQRRLSYAVAHAADIIEQETARRPHRAELHPDTANTFGIPQKGRFLFDGILIQVNTTVPKGFIRMISWRHS